MVQLSSGLEHNTVMKIFELEGNVAIISSPLWGDYLTTLMLFDHEEEELLEYLLKRKMEREK